MEDEDVIFENSPLYQHLKENSNLLNLFDAHPTATEKPVEATAKSDVLTLEKSNWNLVEYFHNIFLPNHPTKKDLRQLQKIVLSSPLVEKDDVVIIESIDPNATKTNVSTTDLQSSSFFIGKVQSAALVLLGIAIAIMPFEKRGLVLCGFSLCLMLAFIARRAIIKSWTTQVESSISLLEDFSNATGSYLKAYSKSLQLLRDLDVIAKGYRGSCHWLQPNPGNAPADHCLALRQLMYESSREILCAGREATIQLVKRLSLGVYLDHSDHYLAFLSLDEIGLSVDSTDLAVSDLRDVYSLTKRQISELLRRLALSFSPITLRLDELSRVERRRRFHVATQCTRDLLQNLILHAKRREYELSAAFRTQKVSLQGSERVNACHALELRLQSTLLRVRQLAAELADSKEDVERVGALAKWIEADVDLCASSCADLQHALQPASPQLAEREESQQEETGTSHQRKEVCFRESHSRDSDEEEEEKIYEGIADSSDDRERLTGAQRRVQLEERQRRAEESLGMIRELKSVLAAKAVEKGRLKTDTSPAIVSLDPPAQKAEKSECRYAETDGSQWMSEAAFAAAALAAKRRHQLNDNDDGDMEASGEKTTT